MKCDSNMMLKIAGGLSVTLAAAYFTFPAAQALIPASAPILIALICSVAMLLMMQTMNSSAKDESAKPENRRGRMGQPGEHYSDPGLPRPDQNPVTGQHLKIMSIKKRYQVMMTALVLFASFANAQAAQPNVADAALVNRVKNQVINELRKSGAIDQAVDAGIARYVQRQRAEAAQHEQPKADTRAASLRPVSKSRDHIRGNPAAPVTLVEYSDFECPFCKRFYSTLKELVNKSNGQVKWVYRYFPLDELHPVKARKEAVAAECAAELSGNDAFWKFADRFFELTPSNNKTDVDTVLPQIAREIGLDKARFASCLTSGRHDRRIEEDHQDAVASGGQDTPWSIIVSKSDKTYPLSGAQPYATVKQLIGLALQEK